MQFFTNNFDLLKTDDGLLENIKGIYVSESKPPPEKSSIASHLLNIWSPMMKSK